MSKKDDPLTTLARSLADDLRGQYRYDVGSARWLKRSFSGNSWENERYGPQVETWQAMMNSDDLMPTQDHAAEIDMRLRALLAAPDMGRVGA